MKKKVILISILFGVLAIPGNLQAADNEGFWEGLLSEATQFLHTAKASPGKSKNYYKTWTVVAVTNDTIVLQRKKRSGKTVDVSIARSRRPYLKVGDRVRYDKVRNRLRRTLDR